MSFNMYWNGIEVINPTLFSSLIVTVALILLILIAGSKIKKADPSKPPKGIVFAMEFFVTNIEAFAKSTMGEKNLKFAPFIGTLAIYLAVANLSGLLGLPTPTSDYSVALSLAVTTLAYIAIAGVKSKGVFGYLKDTYLGDLPAMLPLNIIGQISRPISLSFRLFGNILSGMIIIALLTNGLTLLSVIMPLANAYFDIFAGLMQTMIFIMLTMIWLQEATE